MKKTVLWCLLSACVALAVGYSLPHVKEAFPPAKKPAPTTLEDELTEITTRYAAMDHEVHQRQINEADRAELWEENRKRRQAEMRGAYARHGRDYPGTRE